VSFISSPELRRPALAFTAVTARDFVPEHFVPPAPLRAERFEFQVLGPEHNEQDQPAWTGSIEHIRATPGFGDRTWPSDPESLSKNLLSLS
jgi:hypothetical protein